MSALKEAPKAQDTTKRDNAFALAQQRRRERTAAKDEVKGLCYHDGLIKVASLLADPPACINSLEIEDLLLWIQRFGKSMAADVLDTLGISPVKQIREVTEHKRLMLARYLVAQNDTERIAVIVDRSNALVLQLTVGQLLRRTNPAAREHFGLTLLAELGATLNTPLMKLTDEQHHALVECVTDTATEAA